MPTLVACTIILFHTSSFPYILIHLDCEYYQKPFSNILTTWIFKQWTNLISLPNCFHRGIYYIALFQSDIFFERRFVSVARVSSKLRLCWFWLFRHGNNDPLQTESAILDVSLYGRWMAKKHTIAALFKAAP